MGIWERVKRWMGGKSQPGAAAPLPPSGKPKPNTVPLVKEPSTDLPSPGDAPVDLFSLLFSRKDKHTTTMLNSISLSSDMNTLYLIDNGRAIPFDLRVSQGVLVGMIGGQLVVATAVAPTVVDDAPVGTPRSAARKYTFKAGADSQFTLNFNAKHRALGIIGVDDVVIHLEAPDSVPCSTRTLSLDNQKIVRITRTKDTLEIEEV
jgi:hypothetical protein